LIGTVTAQDIAESQNPSNPISNPACVRVFAEDEARSYLLY